MTASLPGPKPPKVIDQPSPLAAPQYQFTPAAMAKVFRETGVQIGQACGGEIKDIIAHVARVHGVKLTRAHFEPAGTKEN